MNRKRIEKQKRVFISLMLIGFVFAEFFGSYYNKEGLAVTFAATEKFSPENSKKGLTGLRKKVNSELKGKAGTWSVYVKNLDTNEYMVINNKKLPSASLIKLYVMMEAYDEVRKKNIKEDDTFKGRMNRMITISSNYDTNMITASLTKKNTFDAGKKKVNSYCKKHGYTKTKFVSKMGLSDPANVTSVKDTGFALERMYRKTAVSKSKSKKMIKFLKAQTRRNKIPAGIPEGVVVANKTGETAVADNDAAIVYSKGADYVIVVMSKNAPGSTEEIRKISKMVYEYFN